MSDLNCAIGTGQGNVKGLGECLTLAPKTAPVMSAYGGVYRCEACTAAYLAAMPRTEAESFAGVCERCNRARPFVAEMLGYARLCSDCLTVITTQYSYVEFMAATNGTGNARVV